MSVRARIDDGMKIALLNARSGKGEIWGGGRFRVVE